MATWQRANLERHHAKRVTRDAGCFEDVLAIRGRSMTVAEYESASQDVIANAWMVYEAEKSDRNGGYDAARVTFVEPRLLVTVADLGRTTIVTCFHEHFDYPHGRKPGPGTSVTVRKLKYRESVRWDEQGGELRNVKVIRNV